MSFAIFKSIGAYVPEKVLTNTELEQMVDTTDDWIMKRTGIKERRIAAEGELTSDLALKASLKAIERAGIDKEEIDLVVFATITPDFLCMPSTACILADKLGLKNVAAFDISAACSGFIYALSVAKAYIESGMKKTILVIGAETLSRVVDYTDRSTCILFGDGAGAAIITASESKENSVLDIHTSADGGYWDFLITPLATNGKHGGICSSFIQMKGNETFKLAVKTLSSDCINILENNGMDSSNIDHFIPHQANYRIIKAVGESVGLPDEKVVLTVEKYGNTSAASIPMAINDMYEAGKLKKGQLMLLDAFGGGLTWGSCLAYFDGN
ncbi:MAG: beta-ketoacyl-ACP synthase III [Campylobacterales bacterium]